MSIISGPFLCFECSKPKEIVMTIHRLYSDKQEAQEENKEDQRTRLQERSGY